ncbi:MAG: ferritin-like domain-containing protein [Polyangiaceae bacterium]
MRHIRGSIERLQALLALSLGAGSLFAMTSCENEVVKCDAPDALGDGLEQCKNGLVRRVTAVECTSELPRTQICLEDVLNDECSIDADCNASPNGFCSPSGGFDGPVACRCTYGCTTDAECGANAFCQCSSPVGYCVSSNCRTGADCEEGLSCAEYHTDTPGCEGGGFACQTSDDECAVDADCEGELICAYDGTKRSCVAENPCAIGRPFLVANAARLAPILERPCENDGVDGWSSAGKLELDGLDEEARASIGRHFAEMGAMEHASIAAFARFTLQLLELGAPRHLVEQAQIAMADETRHARVAFTLASRIAGHAVEPGPLSLASAELTTTRCELLRVVFREGCVGETIAAIEAGVAAREARSPIVREVFETIEREEGQHALLAWQTVAWLLEGLGAEGARIVEEELAWMDALPDPPASPPAPTGYGVLDAPSRRTIWQRAKLQIVRPAARALGVGRSNGLPEFSVRA